MLCNFITHTYSLRHVYGLKKELPSKIDSTEYLERGIQENAHRC